MKLIFVSLIFLANFLALFNASRHHHHYRVNDEMSSNKTPKVRDIWTNACDECQLV